MLQKLYALKNQKKGFTLVEMLVVIAIIAILVAIIIPVMTNSTTKAKAATDAANLRSVKAEASILYLENSNRTDYVSKITDGATCKSMDDATLVLALSGEKLDVFYLSGGKYYSINDFAATAKDGSTLASTGALATGATYYTLNVQ